MNWGIQSCLLGVILCTAAFSADDWSPADLILERDASGNIQVPPFYWADQESVGKYRLDGLDTNKDLNCIFLEFHKEIQYARKQDIWAKTAFRSFEEQSKTVKVQEFWLINPLRPKNQEESRMLRIVVTAATEDLLERLKSDALTFIKHNTLGSDANLVVADTK